MIRLPPTIRNSLDAYGLVLKFSARTVAGIVDGRVLRRYFGEVLRQAGVLIVGSLVVIMGMVFSLGLVIGVEASYAAKSVGAAPIAGAAAAIADLREIAPLAFGIMMAAKVSTGYAAEIGAMRITDEIDAIEVMGMDSLLYLSSTRLLGMWLVIPFVYAAALAVSFVASYLAVVVQLGTVSAGGYLKLFWQFQTPLDFVFSLSKGMAMATAVVLIGCYYGYNASGGPAGVGRAAATAMGVNILAVVAISMLGSALFWGGNPRLVFGG